MKQSPFLAFGAIVLVSALTAQEPGSPAKNTVPSADFALVNVPGTTALDASPEDLKKYGYTEDEYYVSGQASRYSIDQASHAVPMEGTYPYRTRMIVRRPTDRTRFNGTVTVESYNVTTGQDIDFDWAASHAYLMCERYAVVSVSAQQVGIKALKAWNAARYGSLTADAPAIGQAGGRVDNDPLVWDIYSQTIQGLRHPRTANPLPGFAVRHVIANGESQSALRLSTYYNAIDPLHRVVDGIIFYDAASPLRTDSSTKAISIATEIGIGLGPDGFPAPDNTNYRRWEVAGASHVSYWDMEYVDAVTKRDGYLKLPDGKASSLTGVISGCAWSPAWSTVPTGYVISSAFDHMNKWIQGLSVPPSAPRFERDKSDSGAALRRDSDGRVIGGIRLAEFEFPIAEIKGGGNTGGPSCSLTGMHRFYTPQELKARYPDLKSCATRAATLNAQNVKAGYVLATDAAASNESACRIGDSRAASDAQPTQQAKPALR